MAAARRGNAPSFTSVRRGTSVIKEIRRGTTLKWASAGMRDDFSDNGFLPLWINELDPGDLGALISDEFGRLLDGLNLVGHTTAYVPPTVQTVSSPLGSIVSTVPVSPEDAYCSAIDAIGGMFSGEVPDGLIGLVNGIPIIGGILAAWLSGKDGIAEIDSLIGTLPIMGNIAQLLGLVPDSQGVMGDPINYVVNVAGQVIGKLSCGKFIEGDGSIENVHYVIGGVNGAAKMLIPDGLISLDTQVSRMRYSHALAADDGWLETQIAEEGSPGYVTQVFRRYANNGTASSGVGLDFRWSSVSIVARVGGIDYLVRPNIGSYSSGDTFRLIQTGNKHQLMRNGAYLPGGLWTDSLNSAPSGSNNRSIGMMMQGAKDLLGTKRLSASLNYVDAG